MRILSRFAQSSELEPVKDEVEHFARFNLFKSLFRYIWQLKLGDSRFYHFSSLKLTKNCSSGYDHL